MCGRIGCALRSPPALLLVSDRIAAGLPSLRAARSVRLHHLLGSPQVMVLCHKTNGQPLEARNDIEWIDIDPAPPYDATVRFTGPKDGICEASAVR
jgi:hypothetical protein